MTGFDKMPSDQAYTMHREKVLKEARKATGLKTNSKAYKDLILRIMGMSLEIFEDNIGLFHEVVAYALDYETQGKSKHYDERDETNKEVFHSNLLRCYNVQMMGSLSTPLHFKTS